MMRVIGRCVDGSPKVLSLKLGTDDECSFIITAQSATFSVTLLFHLIYIHKYEFNNF